MSADGLAANIKKKKESKNKATASNKWVAPETARRAIWADVPFWWTLSLEVVLNLNTNKAFFRGLSARKGERSIQHDVSQQFDFGY